MIYSFVSHSLLDPNNLPTIFPYKNGKNFSKFILQMQMKFREFSHITNTGTTESQIILFVFRLNITYRETFQQRFAR